MNKSKMASTPAQSAQITTHASPKLAEEALSNEFREYSVAEFFKKNRQMLGYSGKVRSLTTIVHEYVTNSLDACEEAGILPNLAVEISNAENEHLIVVAEDNGTGIPKQNIGQALGMLLAGTKFHQRKQKRGQQGIGAAYATLFAQITTGKPTKVKSSLGNGKVYECEITLDVKKNAALIKNEKEYSGSFRGLRVEAEFSEVEFKRGEYGVYEYLRRTAIANPHAQVTLVEPNKEITVFPRATTKIPAKPKATMPHPLGITTSDLIDIAHVSSARKIGSMLESEFTRISGDKVKELQAMCPNIDMNRAPKGLQWPEAEALVKAFQTVKWIAPDLDTMSPIGEEQIEKSLKNIVAPEQMKVVERKPRVFRGGIPFMVEAAIAFGGKSGASADVAKGEILRFANRTPLLFDSGTCAITEAVKTIDWARYDLKDWENMPVSIFVNFTSVYVPYTGAGKLAISTEDELVAEIRFALMDCARNISTYLHALKRAEEQEQRRTLFFRYIGEVAQALHDVTGKEKTALEEKLRKIAVERTKILEAEDSKEALEEVGDLEADVEEAKD